MQPVFICLTYMNRKSILISFLTITFSVILYCFTFSCDSFAKNIVVVIDPGHGGDALGGNIDDRIERDINLITATAMKERLEQYDGIDVYLTRTNNEDKELTRKQRFEFAQYVDADFLFSIHYNMSANHTLYGSEVWVCSSGPFYQMGKSFATIEMESLTSLGLFDRGIKCKLASDGDEYYGILKYGREFSIPSVIIEHCHLDEERDSEFWNEESYIKFGEIDADSVAKYYGLASTSLNLDFSRYEKIEFEDNNTEPDTEAPLYCNVELVSNDDLSAQIKVSSKDNETYIQYYSYSLDNGVSWSRLESWPDRNEEETIFTVDLLENKEAQLIVKTQDKYDNDLDSEIICLPMAVIYEEVFDDPEDNDKTDYQDIYINPPGENNEENKNGLNKEIIKEELINKYNILANSNQTDNNLLRYIIIILVTGTAFLILGTIIWFICVEAERKRRKKKTNNETR